jgi:hypothetical protein
VYALPAILLVRASTTEPKSTPTTTAATARSAAPARAKAGALRKFNQLRVDFLLGLLQNVEERSGRLGVVAGEKGDGRAGGACTSRAADTMHIVLNVSGEIKVDDKLDVLDIYSTKG